VNIYEINLYPPRFLSSPYTMIGYTINNVDQIPTFNGSINDMDTVRTDNRNKIKYFILLESKIDLWVFV
jgi:hypothetical protein